MIRLHLAVVVTLMFATLANGNVRVRRICFNTSGTVISNQEVASVASGLSQVITIDPTSFASCGASTRATFRIYTDLASEDIGLIQFVGSGGAFVNDVLITASDITDVDEDTDPAATAQDWAGLDPGPYQMQFQASIRRDLLGPVSAGNIVRLRVGGTISAAGDITQTDATHPIRSVLAVGDIAGDVVAGSGTVAANGIVRVRSNTGNISGVIRAWAGTVGTVEAPSGTISGPITSDRGEITLITAKNITSTITADGKLQSYVGYYAIGQIIATEDIGTSTQSAVIQTFAGQATVQNPDPNARNRNGFLNGGIRLVQARNIFAIVSTPIPPNPLSVYSATNPRGDIREIKTTGALPTHGILAGTVSTFTLGETTGGPTRTLDVSGNLTGQINLAGTIKNPVRIGGALATGGRITLSDQDLIATGDITVVGALAGRIEIDGSGFGDLTVNPGSMTGTIKVMGDLGTSSHLRVGGPLSGSIEIGQNLLGQLSLTGPSLSGTVKVMGNMCSATATTCAMATIAGAVTPTGRIEIDGSVFAPTTGGDPVFDMITFTALQPMAGTLRIGESLFGRVITARPLDGGLSGQVVVKANNGAGQFGANARVRVGQVGQVGWLNIATANYASPLSGAIGGGAVGFGVYQLHREDCAPPYQAAPTATLLTSSFLATPPNGAPAGLVRIRSYGPMKIHPDYTAATALRVEVQNPDNCFDWYPAQQFFTVTLFPGGNKRVIELTRISQSVPYAGVYRVVPEGLVCEESTDEPSVNWPTDYHGGTSEGAYVFRIGSDCGGPTFDQTLGSPPNGILDGIDIIGNAAANPPVSPCSGCDQNSNYILDWCETSGTTCACDWNGTGAVTVQDLFDFLACYFAGDGDINNSGATTVQDIFDFLNCYFALPLPCVRG